MSPLEELRNHIKDNQSVHLALGNDKGLDRNASWLSALDALIAERDSLKARAVKAEAENDALKSRLSLAQHHASGRHGDYTRALEERDELRKALEPFKRIDLSQITHGNFICMMLSRAEAAAAHAALHGTAKQEPKPRTCGECAHYNDSLDRCHSMLSPHSHTTENARACEFAEPRADAQKGQA